MNNRIIIFLFLIISVFSYAQVHELGLSSGGSNYIGDVGSETYVKPNDLYYGLIYKWNYSSRISFRAQASYIKIKADDADSNNEIRRAHGYSFKNAVKEFAVGLDFNYYNYSLIKKDWNSTPYLIVEFAVFNYNAVTNETTPNNFETQDVIGFTIPVGIGYKTKLTDNVGLGLESILRYTLVDDLDYNYEGYPQLNFGNPDSNDWYLTVGMNFVFGFGRKACYSGTF